MGQSASTTNSSAAAVEINSTVNSSQTTAGHGNSSQQPNEQPTTSNEAVACSAHTLPHAEPLESESIERFESSQSSNHSESDASNFSLISRPHSPATPNSSNSSNHSFEHIAPHSPNSTHSHPPSPIEVIETPSSSYSLTRSNSSLSSFSHDSHLAAASANLECNTPFSTASVHGEEEKQPIEQLDEPTINQSEDEEPTFLGTFNSAGHCMCCDETEPVEYEDYDEYDEEDDEPYGYDQGDEIYGRCTLADVCDLRQRHQSRFGDRVTYKSQRTRKQQKQERALVLYQMRAVKAKQKAESKAATPPQPFQSKSAKSNPSHPAYPHNTTLAEIQSYGMQRYGDELKKKFNNGFTEVVSIEPTPIRGVRKPTCVYTSSGYMTIKEDRLPLAPTTDFNFNPHNSDPQAQPLPALQSVLSCKHTVEGQLQRGTVINRLKPQYIYPAHGYPELVSPWYVSEGHTPDACAAGCSQVVDSLGQQEWNRTSVEFSQARQLILNSTKRCVTEYGPHRQPVQRETDQHMAQFQLECLGNLTSDRTIQAVPIADIKYRIIGLPHAKFNPHGVTQNKTLMRQFNAFKMAALRNKKNKKRQTQSDQQDMDDASISMAAHFSDDELYSTDEDEFQSEEQPSLVEECALPQVEPEVTMIADEPVELCESFPEMEEEMDIEDIMVLESDRTWHRFLEGGGFEEDCHLWPRYAHMDCDRIMRKAAQPKAVTPRHDAYGTQVNLGPTQARESYEPKHTHPCRTRHRQELGQMKGGKKSRKEMKALTLLSNQKRKEMAQELMSQPPTMTLNEKSAAGLKSLRSSIAPLSQTQLQQSAKKLTRHDIHNTSHKARQDYPSHASKRGPSQSQRTLPANHFKNQTWKTKKVIHLHDLNLMMLENAAKVESGESKLTPPPKTYDAAASPTNRARQSKRRYWPGWNRRHYPALRFQFSLDDITLFNAAFYQLWKTRIEQILNGVHSSTGLRILSIEPYEGDKYYSKTSFMHLLSLMNDHQHGRGSPLTTEFSLRFHAVGRIYRGYRPNQIEALFVKDNVSPNRLRSEPDDHVRELSVQCCLNGDRRAVAESSWGMIPCAKVTYQLIPTRVPFRALKSKEVRVELARIQQADRQLQASRRAAQKSSTLHNTFDRAEKAVTYPNLDSDYDTVEWFSRGVRWYQQGLEWLPEEIDYQSHMAEYESDSERDCDQYDYEIGGVGNVDSPLLSSSHCCGSSSSGPSSSSPLPSPPFPPASIVSTDDEDEADGSNHPPADSSARWENSNNQEQVSSYHCAEGDAFQYDDDDNYNSDDYHGYDHVTGLAGDYDSHWSEGVSVGHRRGFNLNGLGSGRISIRSRHHIRHVAKRTAKPKTTKRMDIQRARSTRC